jgi:phosphoglucosamine mutase
MGELFGTDGVRGVANEELTPEVALSLGRGVVTVLREDGMSRPSVLIGRDPRWSGDLIESALAAGIVSAGGDAVTVGVLPTPGVAYLASISDVAAGAVISASHNPMGDNGIKFFGVDGFKFDDEGERRLEEIVAAGVAPRPTGTDLGRVYQDPSRTSAYVEHLVTAADHDLTGLRLVVDGANGAASQVAPLVYRRLGADVIAIHCAPNGANINDGCGSTHPEVVAEAVRESGADVGLAHDGDADRVIAATAAGEVVDGDRMLAILALHRREHDRLPEDGVVTTVMTNLGFKRAMREHGVDVVETQVGDRFVLQEMRARGLALGGEQSGHLIQLDCSTTGDGILTAVTLLDAMRESGASLAELAAVMERLPQVLVNVRVEDKDALADDTTIWEAVSTEEEELGDDGRVLVRASGTEPVIRVMVEALEEPTAKDVAERIAAVVRERLG